MIKEHILFRIKRARETYQDAIYLYERGSINSSVNRLYYAAFYASIALLLHKGIEIKSHKGVKQKLGEEFVLKDIISKDLAKAYSILSDYRHKGDDDDLYDVDKDIVEQLLDQIKNYIDKIVEIINQ